MVGIFPSSRPNIAVRVIPKLPATLTASGGLGVTKVGGVWTFSPQWQNLQLIAPGVMLDPTTKEIWTRDPISNIYNRMTLGGLGQALFWGTSTTSLTIATSGTIVLTTQSNKDWPLGSFLQVASQGTPADYMVGQVTAYVGNQLTLNVVGGQTVGHVHADWLITPTIAGVPTVTLTVGTSVIVGGTSGNYLFDNAGILGEKTPTQLTADVGLFTSTIKGAVPASGGGTLNFLRADGTWASGATVTVGDTPPASPNPGALWWDSVGANLYIWYIDPTGPGQWVVVINQQGATANFVQKTGDTMTGSLSFGPGATANIPLPTTSVATFTTGTGGFPAGGGSGTYTVPAGCRRIEVRAMGGGGGGAGSGTTPGAAGAGGNTTFGPSIVANGGGAGTTSGGLATGGTASGCDVAIAGGNSGYGINAGSQPGGDGGVGVFGGNGKGSFYTLTAAAGLAAPANTGGGGGGASCGATAASGSGGGAGGYGERAINSPAATYAYAVGAGGAAGTAGTSGAAGGAGGSGIIIVKEFY
jgi:hypothetical protein